VTTQRSHCNPKRGSKSKGEKKSLPLAAVHAESKKIGRKSPVLFASLRRKREEKREAVQARGVTARRAETGPVRDESEVYLDKRGEATQITELKKESEKC